MQCGYGKFPIRMALRITPPTPPGDARRERRVTPCVPAGTPTLLPGHGRPPEGIDRGRGGAYEVPTGWRGVVGVVV